VFAGVAQPADFRDSLTVEVARFRRLPDHSVITPALAADLEAWAGGLPMVTTAKDAVRVEGPLGECLFWRDVSVDVLDAPEQWFPPMAARAGTR
jgi:tetraacyldisaccharide-1-P 4'-kinase